MNLLLKISFRFTTLIFSLLDKYRAAYYGHLYIGQVNLADDLKLGRYSSVVIYPGAKKAFLKVSKSCVFRKFCIITLDSEGKLAIGENNFFNNNFSINCLGEIEIGINNIFGECIKIYDHNHIYNKMEGLISEQGFKIGKIKIGDNCWIGSNCIILNNVTIGDNVVIGANNLVHKSVPSNTIVKARVYFDYQAIERMSS